MSRDQRDQELVKSKKRGSGGEVSSMIPTFRMKLPIEQSKEAKLSQDW
jgi:hypothetical protein